MDFNAKDTNIRDMGGNLIARRAPNVDRDGWLPRSPAHPLCREGSLVTPNHLTAGPPHSRVDSLAADTSSSKAPLSDSDPLPDFVAVHDIINQPPCSPVPVPASLPAVPSPGAASLQPGAGFETGYRHSAGTSKNKSKKKRR